VVPRRREHPRQLFSVVDFARSWRASAPAAGQPRLVLFGPRGGELNAGIVVPARAGLAQPRRARARAAARRPAWYAQRWMDGDGNAWQEIDLRGSRSIPRSCRLDI
jgi:hypothetical protein